MTDPTPGNEPMNNSDPSSQNGSGTKPAVKPNTTELVKATLARRYAAEKRFRWYGIIAIAASLSFLVVLLTSIFIKGWPAFTHAYVKLNLTLDASTLGIGDKPTTKELRAAKKTLGEKSAVSADQYQW